MPLHINLLHEELAKTVERKRDPLKIGILALLVVAVAAYGYYIVRSVASQKFAVERTSLEDQFKKLDPKAKEAKDLENSSRISVASTEAIEKLINSRFYWGPLLSEIVAGTGPEIQFIGFEGAAKSEDSVTFNVIGVSAGREPRAVAERFRQSLGERLRKSYSNVSSQFVSLENSETPLVIAGKSFATANFSIAFQLTPNTK